MLTWSKAYKNESTVCDFTLVRLYRRFVELDCLNAKDHKAAKEAILHLEMDCVRRLLASNFGRFKEAVMNSIEAEKGQKLLRTIEKQLFVQIQLSFFDEGAIHV